MALWTVTLACLQGSLVTAFGVLRNFKKLNSSDGSLVTIESIAFCLRKALRAGDPR